MDDDLLSFFINPRTSKILLDIYYNKNTRTSDICNRNPSIPRSTMYRLLSRMEHKGLIEVTDYQRKRGCIEKTYSISEKCFPEINPEDATYADLSAYFIRYCIEFAAQFHGFAEEHQTAVCNEPMGFWVAPVYATDRELMALVENMGQMVKRYSDRTYSEGRKLRSLGLIVAPPSREDEDR